MSHLPNQPEWLESWAQDGFERRRQSRQALGAAVRVGLGEGTLADMALLDVSVEGCLLRATGPSGAAVDMGDPFVVGFRDEDGDECTAGGHLIRRMPNGVIAATIERCNEAFSRWLTGLGQGEAPWA